MRTSLIALAVLGSWFIVIAARQRNDDDTGVITEQPAIPLIVGRGPRNEARKVAPLPVDAMA